jgi:hypothetical protein
MMYDNIQILTVLACVLLARCFKKLYAAIVGLSDSLTCCVTRYSATQKESAKNSKAYNQQTTANHMNICICGRVSVHTVDSSTSYSVHAMPRTQLCRTL